MMRAGQLDRIITIQRVTTTVDDYGTPVEGWAIVATVRGHRVHMNREEFAAAYGQGSQALTTFRIRHLDGLTLADRLTCDGETFDIKGIEPIGRREAMELRCVAHGAA